MSAKDLEATIRYMNPTMNAFALEKNGRICAVNDKTLESGDYCIEIRTAEVAVKADEVHGKLESRVSALEKRSYMKAIKGTTTEAEMVSWWIRNDDVSRNKYPNEGETEKDICQPFVTKILEAFTQADIPENSLYYPTDAIKRCSGIQLTSVVDNQAYREVSFDGRKPDVVSYEAGCTGSLAITFIGDVKRRSMASVDFTDQEQGHILDMGFDLMNIQRHRLFLICFLTDGFRFQFFKIDRREGNEYYSQYSVVFKGLSGWQILAGLFSVPLIDIGFASIKLRGYSLRELLGYGRFSAVYSAVKDDTGREVVVKVFSGDDDGRGVIMRDNETRILSELLRGNNDGSSSSSSSSSEDNSPISHHVPQVIEVGQTICVKPVLVLDKIGYPLQPLDKGVRAYMEDFAALVRVVQYAHGLDIFHRDISISNIFYDKQSNKIFLNDWSSAHKRCSSTAASPFPSQEDSVKWVGTPYFSCSRADGHGNH
eukprot:gene36525-47580_t